MAIIDVQVHAYEHNHPGRPWVGHIGGWTMSRATRWWRQWTP